jgi:hypothetical protein
MFRHGAFGKRLGHDHAGLINRWILWWIHLLGSGWNYGRWGLFGVSGSLSMYFWRAYLVPGLLFCQSVCFLNARRWVTLLHSTPYYSLSPQTHNNGTSWTWTKVSETLSQIKFILLLNGFSQALSQWRKKWLTFSLCCRWALSGQILMCPFLSVCTLLLPINVFKFPFFFFIRIPVRLH